MTLQALRSFGPAPARSALRNRYPTLHEECLVGVSSDPASLDRVGVQMACGVVRELQDPAVLASLLLRRQRRTLVDTLRQHPRCGQAIDLALKDHPWAAMDADGVISCFQTYHEYRLPCSLPVSPDVLLSCWLRQLPREGCASAYRRVLEHLPGPPPVAALLDVLLGTVPGLRADDLPWCVPTAARDDHVHPASTRTDPCLRLLHVAHHDTLQSEADRLVYVDRSEARFLIDNHLSIRPFLHSFSNEALELLVSNPATSVEILEFELVSACDHVEAVAALMPEGQARVLSAQPHPALLRQFLSPLVGRLPANSLLANLVMERELADDHVLLAALRLASPYALAKHLCNQGPNPSDCAHVDFVVGDLFTHPASWCTSWHSLIRTLRAQHRTSVGRHLVERILERHHDPLEILAYDGLVGEYAVQRAVSVLGTDPASWEILVGLAGQWEGSFSELLLACRSISGSSSNGSVAQSEQRVDRLGSTR